MPKDFKPFAERVLSQAPSSDPVVKAAELYKGLYAPLPNVGTYTPRTYFADPFSLLNDMGMGYQEAPTNFTYATLKRMCEKDPIVGAIIETRISQISSFCTPQRNKYSIGFRISPKDRDKKLTDGERTFIRSVEDFLIGTGLNTTPDKDDFDSFVKKFVRDTLYYDQGCFEVIPRMNGKPHSFYAVSGETIRIASPKTRRATVALNIDEARKRIAYVQVIDGKVVAEYEPTRMAFCVMNPRADLKVYKYGFAPCEKLILSITSHLWAEEWNRRMFSQGSTIRGIVNFQGNIPQDKLEDFRRQWLMQISGVTNAWRTPIMASEGIQFVPMQMNNNEMGFMGWMEYLIKIISAVFQIDPAEINFDMRGGMGNAPMFMSTNEAQQKMSKDKGMSPLLRHVAKALNKYIINPLAPWLEFEFVGLDAKSEEQAIQLRVTELQSYKTLNEVRSAEGLSPVPHGDIVMNPTYTGIMMQREQMAAQQAQMSQQQGQAGAGGAMGGKPVQKEDFDHDKIFTDKVKEKQAGGEKPEFESTERDAAANLEAVAKDTKKQRAYIPQPGAEEQWEESTHSGPLKSVKPDLMKAELPDHEVFE